MTTNITCKYTAFVGVDKHSKGIVAKGIYLFDIQIQEFEGTKFLELQIRKLKTGISSKKLKMTCCNSIYVLCPHMKYFFIFWTPEKVVWSMSSMMGELGMNVQSMDTIPQEFKQKLAINV